MSTKFCLDCVCDVCLGVGSVLSGKQCACGGTGKMVDTVTYLRERNHVAAELIERYINW